MRLVLLATVLCTLSPALTALAATPETPMCQEPTAHATAHQIAERERLDERSPDLIPITRGDDIPWCMDADDPRCSPREPAEASGHSGVKPLRPDFAAPMEPALAEPVRVTPQLGFIARSDGFGARVERPPQL